jgi:HNH endonuclease
MNSHVVDEQTGCWIWQGGRNTDGRYGRAVPSLGGKMTAAHRIYWERENGPIPEGLVIDHLCRNGLCVNPAHLEVVTQAENNRRRTTTKLTERQAAFIRQSLAEEDGYGSGAALARRFGVSPQLICDIKKGRAWVAPGEAARIREARTA